MNTLRSLACVGLLLALGPGCPDPDHAPRRDGSVEPVDTGDAGDTGLDASEPPLADAGHDAGAAERDAAPPWPDAPALRNPVSLPDAELAVQALTLMGSAAVGAEGRCRDCHALGRSTLSRWRELSRAASQECLADALELESPEVIDSMLGCIRWREAKGPFLAEGLGIYSSAAHLPWFSFAFEHAPLAGADWAVKHADFVASAGMPRSGEPWTQPEFDVVAEWFERGMPGFRELVPPDPGTEPCQPSLMPELLAHLEQMKTRGWAAKNRQAGMLMYGCEAQSAPLDCLSELPLAREQDYGAGWDVGGSSIRLLRDNSDTPSLYWTRTSPDGRYMASARSQDGPGYGAQLYDLARGAMIEVNAGVDPGFFPDNSGFVYQGASNRRALVCGQGVLLDNPEYITGAEPECELFGTAQVGIYEQLGKSLDGSDYWASFGEFAADDGGFERTLDNPPAPFDANSDVRLTPLLNEGGAFRTGRSTDIPTPSEGDPVMSVSGKLLITRAKGADVEGPGGFEAPQNGYRIYLLDVERSEAGLRAGVDEVGRICEEGGKFVLSYDERWAVYHHYVEASDAEALGFTGPDDPAFAAYLEEGAANLYLIDLRSGESTRITAMQPGQYALFPHFRSDGWIYFVVRTPTNQEYFAASDAALLAEAQ
jgi:hypothetical protein